MTTATLAAAVLYVLGAYMTWTWAVDPERPWWWLLVILGWPLFAVLMIGADVLEWVLRTWRSHR